MKNKLAIVIPYYKIDFFEETIKSVAEQTDQRFTLYIGNDASPNDPLPIIEKYLGDVSYNYYDYKENLGGKNLALQWERILENVEEEWFVVLGDDDTISDNYVAAFNATIEEVTLKDIKAIKVAQYWIDSDGNRLNETTANNKIINAVNQFLLEYHHQYRSSLSEHIFRRKAFLPYGFKKFPLAWHTDNLALYETCQFDKIYFIKEANVKVRMSSVNISSQTDDNHLKTEAQWLFREHVLKHYYRVLPKDFVMKELQNYRAYLWRNNLKSRIPLFMLYLKLGLLKKAGSILIYKK